MKISKITTILQWVLMLISIVVFVYLSNNISSLDPDATLDTQKIELSSVTDLTLNWIYVLLAISIGGLLVFHLISFAKQLMHEPVEALKGLAGVGVIAIILFISYSLGDPTPLHLPGYTGSDNVPDMLILADASIYSMYFLGGIAIVGIVFSEFAKAFK